MILSSKLSLFLKDGSVRLFLLPFSLLKNHPQEGLAQIRNTSVLTFPILSILYSDRILVLPQGRERETETGLLQLKFVPITLSSIIPDMVKQL